MFRAANVVEPFNPSRFVTENNKIKINGKQITYKTICEDNVIYNENGVAMGSIFSYSYFRTDVDDPARPVIFVFNGGPGCGVVWMHLGMFGPLHLKLDDPVNPPTVPPFEVTENPYCLLDDADLVMIDPVGTGYGVLLNSEFRENFYDIMTDAEAMCDFIELWTNRYQRWQSPKYLAGESYGTTRACTVAGIGTGDTKRRQYSLSFSGVILIGGGISQSFGTTERSVTQLPTFAATNLYHHPKDGRSTEEFAEECWQFAQDDYLKALFQGNNLKGPARKAIKEKLTYFTGMNDAFLEKNFLRISAREFSWNLLADEGMECGNYDSRYKSPLHQRLGFWDDVTDEASMGKFSPVFLACMQGPVKQHLGITFNRGYEGVSFDCDTLWTHKEMPKTTAEWLASAMRRIEKMQVLFANGYYDLGGFCGQRYNIAQSGLALDRVTAKVYEAGHMPYLGDASLKVLAGDVRKMIRGKKID